MVPRRAQIKECVIEFNKVDRKHKLKRVMRASEFQAKFAGFNATLKCALVRCSGRAPGVRASDALPRRGCAATS